MTHHVPRASAFNRTLVSVAVASCFVAASAFANPAGPQVVSGSASFSQPAAGTLNVTNSPGAIINWQGFSIGASEVTRFIQQSAASAVLNRVTGGNVSQIHGQLLSNGQVFLVNPGGIVVGPGAVVDTAGFVASTLNMVDADFLAGKLRFQGDANSGSIVNQGWIRTGYGGKVVLVAPQIENSGLIHTPGGELLLAAGQKLTVSSLDHPEVQFEVQAPTDSVVNLGKLLADGGAVGVFAGTLRHSGDIRANSLVYDQAGRVVLQAASEAQLAAGSTTTADGKIGGSVTVQATGGLARVAGTVSAQGSAGEGGEVRTLGSRVALVESASLNASGSTAGGTILVGGDYQGGNAQVQNSTDTFVGAGATLRADATGSGNGGRVIVWSDDKAQFYGSLSALGGPAGGDGGFAEVSGRNNLVFAGSARLGAPNGKLGTLLLDPIDLFVDAQGGLLPEIIDEKTDFPANAATVAPETLANIVGNVKLYAARYMRINSAIDLTTTVDAMPTATPGKTLTAEVGTWPDTTTPLAATDPLKLSVGTVPNRLDIGADITTANGSVTLTAPGIQAFAASTITTGGGAVNLSAAKEIQASVLAINAGTGAVNVTAGTDSSATSRFLQLGAVTGGSFTASAPESIQLADAVATDGGAVTVSSANSSFSIFSPIDTRAGGTGPTGGAVSITAAQSVTARAITAGSGNITLSGTTLGNSSGTPLDTTGSVSLTATNGNISSFRINNASAVTANSTNATGSSIVNLSSDTVLNASTVTATTTQCNQFSGSCSSASITLNGEQGVNVGTVSATAPTNFVNKMTYGDAYADERFENINSSVNVFSNAGPIGALSATSLITANNVSLTTTPFSISGGGGGIGSATLPVRVDARSSLTFNPNGAFNAQIVGTTGPNALNMQIGVAPTGQSYTGSLSKSGQINLGVAATDATVTVNTFDVSSGFDTRVSNTSPSIQLYVPNGNLVATSVSVPKGDQVGIVSPASKFAFDNCTSNCPPAPTPTIEGLPVRLWADRDLTVTSYTRATGTLAKVTDFRAFNGMTSLGTVAANIDSLSVFGATGVSIPGLTHGDGLSVSSVSGPISLGTVSVTGSLAASSSSGDISFANVGATIGASASTGSGSITLTGLTTSGSASASTSSGNVTLGSVVSGAGGATVTAPLGTVQALTDSGALEVTSGGAVSIHAKTIGAGGTNPLDLAGSSVSLTSNGAGTIGFSGTPIVANTQNLTVNAANGSTFNVSTGTTNLKNLTVTASPSGVGSGGLARISSNGSTYDFSSDGSGFTLGGANFPAMVPAAQFAGGTLSFTATSGNLVLNSLDMSAGNGSLSAATNGNLANLTQTPGQAINLGAGLLTLKADGNVSVEGVNAGGMNTTNATSVVGSGCATSLGPCGVTSFIANQSLTDTALGNGTWSVTSRGDVTTGALQVSGVALTTNRTGNIATGAIGTAARPATSVSLTSTSSSSGTVQTGAIEANSLAIAARGAVTIGPGSLPTDQSTPVINGTNTGAASVAISSQSTISVNGALNAAALTFTSPSGIATGDINPAAPAPAAITFNSTSAPNISTGSLDAKSIIAQSACSFFYCPPANITVSGAVGAVTKPTTLSLDGSNGTALTIAGAIGMDAAAGSNLNLRSSGAVTLGGTVASGLDPNFRIFAGTTLTGTAGASLGAITATDGSSISLSAGNSAIATPFQFTRIDAGATGSVNVNAPAGIVQTLASGSGGGITAATVSLSANSAGSKIEGASPLTLRETSSLTLSSGGSINLDRTGAGGAPLLSNLDITRSSAFSAFALTGFAAGQSVSIAADTLGGGTNVDLLNTSATPLNFSYRNNDSVNNLLAVTGGGIATKGGSLSLFAGGTLTAGSIDTRSGSHPTVPDGSVSLQSGQTLAVSGTVNSGAGGITAFGNSVTGAGQLVSTSSVFAQASFGNIGSGVLPLAVNSPRVSLVAFGTSPNGNAFAGLTGTTDLTLNANDGFTISNSIAFANLNLTTTGSGTGPVGLSPTGAQSFGLSRNASAVEIASVASTPALSSFRLAVQSGDLTAKGSIAADALTLAASAGTLTLDGSSSALALSNATQNFSGGTLVVQGNVSAAASTSQTMSASTAFNFTGTGTLSSGGSQSLSSSGSLVLTSQGGPLTVSGASQSLIGSGSLAVNAAGGAVTLSASGNQNLFSFGNLDFNASGGALAVQGASQSVGGSTSSVITLQGGAGAGQSVTFTASAQQNVFTSDNVAGSVKLLGGSGMDASASIVYTGTGTQFVQSGNVVLTGGGAAGANAVIGTATGNQEIKARGGISLTGGTGDNALARIVNSGTGSQQVGEARRSCCTFDLAYQTAAITLQGGSGAGSAAEIAAAGDQRIFTKNGTLGVLGGSGAGAFARIESTGAAEQLIGFPTFRDSFGYAHNTVNVGAGTGTGAYARITAAGPQTLTANSAINLTGNGTDASASLTASQQEIRFGAVTVQAGAGNNANALIQATGTQYFNVNGLAVKGAGGAAATATAQVLAGDTQTFDFAGTVTMLGGGGANSFAKISAQKAQILNFSSIGMTGGAGSGSYATIYTDESQSMSGGNVTLAGGTASGAYARINTPKDQTLFIGSLAMTAGGADGAYVKIDSGLKQYLSGGNFSLTAGGVGETTVANASAIIEGQDQEIYGSSISLTGGAGTAGNTSDALLTNLSGNQIVRANGTLTLQGGHQHSTTGIVNQGSGTQSVTGNGGISLVSDTVTPPAHPDSLVVIQNPSASAQTITALFGGFRLDNSGDGVVEVTSGGTQSVQARYIDIKTSAGSTGNSKLAASGDQWIRATNEAASPDDARTVPAPVPAYGLRVAAFGTGTASIESGASQLLEVTYPQVMQGTGFEGGFIVGGTEAGTAVAGTSRIKAVDQAIFAGTIWVETGLNASSPTQQFSEIKASNDQVITTLSGPIRILGGAGNDTLAQIDPVTQTILVNGGIDVIGGSGTNAVAQIVNGSGAQTILATTGNIALTGGTGAGANAFITSLGLQTVGASGAINLTNGINPLGGPGGVATISPLGSIPAGCGAPCILTTTGSSGTLVAQTFATNPVISQLEELLVLAETTLMTEESTIFARRAPICR